MHRGKRPSRVHVVGQHQPSQQPETTDAYRAREASVELRESTRQVLAQIARVLDQPLLVDDVEDGQAGRAGERVAAERARVTPRWQTVREPVGDRHGAEWKASADALGERAGVGHGVEPLLRQEPPRSAVPGLNLVEEEERAALIANALATMMPPSAWTGSTITAAVRSVTAASNAARSLKSMNVTPCTNGSIPTWYFGCPVSESEPIVRP